jgi:hypothetical protein
MEILGLVFGGASALVGVAGLGVKALAWLRSIDAQIAALRLSQAEGDHSCRSELAEIRAQLALIQGQLELARSIASHPRHRPMGEPIE